MDDQEKISEELIDADRIRWIETLSGSRIKVARAALVRFGFGLPNGPRSESNELGLRVVTSSGALCYVPLSTIVRVDLASDS